MLDITPGKEEEFGYLQQWFAFSDRVDRLIESKEACCGHVAKEPPQPAIVPQAAIDLTGVGAGPFEGLRAGPFDRLRAGFAARLARLALALHREAAAGTVIPRMTETPR